VPARNFRTFLAAAIGLAVGYAACAAHGILAAPTAADSTAAARTIEAVVQDSALGAITRHDYDQLRRAVTPDFQLNEDTLRAGLDQLIALVKGSEGKAVVTYRLDEFKTSVHGDVAWTSYRDHGVITPTGAQPISKEWIETAVLLRGPDGRWRVDRVESMSQPAKR
jgi:hypothetical protein